MASGAGPGPTTRGPRRDSRVEVGVPPGAADPSRWAAGDGGSRLASPRTIVAIKQPMETGISMRTAGRTDGTLGLLLYTTLAANSFFTSPYSRLSTSACRLASMMFSLTPIVVQLRVPSLDSIRTRVRAAVPIDESTIRTL